MSQHGSVDLHLHTLYSDGKDTPSELVSRAVALGFTTIAVTDHDTVAGIAEAVKSAAESGSGMRVVAGVEMSSFHDDREIHILGLFIDTANKPLLDVLKRARHARRTRIHGIVEKLAELGVHLDADEVFALADVASGAVGRLHVAEVLIKRGVTNSVAQSFQRYLGPDSPAYVPKWYPEPVECCRLIHEAGGVSVLAHPGETMNRDFIEGLVDRGLRALEAFYPSYGPELTQKYIDLAHELNLGVSGGSDCHGRRKDRILMGKIRLPEDVVTDLEARAGVNEKRKMQDERQ